MTNTTVQLIAVFGQNLVDMLDTEEKKQSALDVYTILADGLCASQARAWMMNPAPLLDGQVPLRALAHGRKNVVVRAAHTMLSS